MPTYVSQSDLHDLLPDGGEWDFICEDAVEKESSSGNEMIELQLRILINESDKGPLVYDNLIFTEKCFWKIDQFRLATGDVLLPGELVVFNADDAIDRKGRLILTVETYQGRKRNRVREYVIPT
jgi:hypothetical protein